VGNAVGPLRKMGQTVAYPGLYPGSKQFRLGQALSNNLYLFDRPQKQLSSARTGNHTTPVFGLSAGRGNGYKPHSVRLRAAIGNKNRYHPASAVGAAASLSWAAAERVMNTETDCKNVSAGGGPLDHTPSAAGIAPGANPAARETWIRAGERASKHVLAASHSKKRRRFL
jgi:hypothetical protein